MIRVLSARLSVLILALVSHAGAQKCDGEKTYSLYSGDLNGKSPEELCKCVESYMHENGMLKDKPFYCNQTQAFNDIKWTYSNYEERTSCEECLLGCKDVYGDQDQICKGIDNMIKPKIAQKSMSVGKPMTALARIIIIVIVVVTPCCIFVGVIIIW